MCSILTRFVGEAQGLIVRSIATPQYPTQIDTMEALDQSGLYVATGTATFRNTFDVPGGSAVMERLFKKTLLLTSQDQWDKVGSCHKRQKPQAPIRSRETS